MSVKRVASSALFIPESDVSDGENGFIYVIGGRTDDKVRTKLCEKYNIEKKKWEPISKMNVGKARASCCYDKMSHSIYCFFGVGSSLQMLNEVEKYDIVKNNWTSIKLANNLIGIFLIIYC